MYFYANSNALKKLVKFNKYNVYVILMYIHYLVFMSSTQCRCSSKYNSAALDKIIDELQFLGGRVKSLTDQVKSLYVMRYILLVC